MIKGMIIAFIVLIVSIVILSVDIIAKLNEPEVETTLAKPDPIDVRIQELDKGIKELLVRLTVLEARKCCKQETKYITVNDGVGMYKLPDRVVQ